MRANIRGSSDTRDGFHSVFVQIFWYFNIVSNVHEEGVFINKTVSQPKKYGSQILHLKLMHQEFCF